MLDYSCELHVFIAALLLYCCCLIWAPFLLIPLWSSHSFRHLPLWLPALRDFILDFVPAQQCGTNFTLSGCFLNIFSLCMLCSCFNWLHFFDPECRAALCFLLRLFFLFMLSAQSFTFLCFCYPSSAILNFEATGQKLWGKQNLTSLFCNFLPALHFLSCKTENKSQPLLKKRCHIFY